MGSQGKATSSTSSMQRVKVYHLNDEGKWDDRGTGHITVDYWESTEDLCLFVVDEEENKKLLTHRIGSDEIYRRQEDTIISWRDPQCSTELALSFQETTGCSYIWDHICSAKRNLQFSTIGGHNIGPHSVTETMETSGSSQANDEAFHGVNSELRELPAVELSTLPSILKIVVESSVADQMGVTELILHDHDFFPKLMDLFRLCEDMENINGLHMIFKLVRGIISLNSPQIFEKIFGDELIMDIIGTLEYDQEISHVRHHRAFLKEHVVLKEAIPVKDPHVLSKINQTHKIGYIKDVILPGLLDDATIANLNSIIHANNAVVVPLLKDDNTFIQELFAKMRSPTTAAESKINLVCFLHEFCTLSKNLQLVQQLRLFRDLINEGIFDIITDALGTQDKKLLLTGTDILVLFLSQDPNLLRTYVIRQEGNTLLGLLVNGMITDFGEDVHCQFLEILRSLLDSYSSGSQRDMIIDIFYEKHLGQLIDVIVFSCPPKSIARSSGESATRSVLENQAVTKPEILSNICELLCFCILHHPFRTKRSFLLNNVIGKVLFLVHRREKYLIVAAVRFVRIIISRNDDQLVSHIVKNNLLKPIVEAFVGNGDRYNLLNSAVLDLFEYIRKENLKTLVMYVIESFWNQLGRFEYLTTIRALKVKYEQFLETYETRNDVNMMNPEKRLGECALEREEEVYFNEISDEEWTSTTFRMSSKLETTAIDGESKDSLRSKCKSIPSEELEPSKKQKLDEHSSDGADIGHNESMCTQVAPLLDNSMSVTPGIPQARNDTCSGKEVNNSEEPGKCSSGLSGTSDTRETGDEGCPSIPTNSNLSSVVLKCSSGLSGTSNARESGEEGCPSIPANSNNSPSVVIKCSSGLSGTSNARESGEEGCPSIPANSNNSPSKILKCSSGLSGTSDTRESGEEGCPSIPANSDNSPSEVLNGDTDTVTG